MIFGKIAKNNIEIKTTCGRAARAPTLKTYFFLISRDVSGNASTVCFRSTCQVPLATMERGRGEVREGSGMRSETPRYDISTNAQTKI